MGESKKSRPPLTRSEGVLRRQCLTKLIDLVERSLPEIEEAYDKRINSFQGIYETGTPYERDEYGKTKQRYETDKKHA